MDKKAWQQQKGTHKDVTDAQQPKEAALAPSVPVERAIEDVPAASLPVNPFSKVLAPKNETPSIKFRNPSFGPQTTAPFFFRATHGAGNTEPPKFSFGATATAEKKNNQREEEEVTGTNTNTVPHEFPPFSMGLSATDKKPTSKKPFRTKNPNKHQTKTTELGVGVKKAEQPQMSNEEMLKTIQRALSSMSTKGWTAEMVRAARIEMNLIDGEVKGKESFLVKGLRTRQNSPFNALIQNLLGLHSVRKSMIHLRTKGAISSPLRKICLETNGCEEGKEKKDKDLLSSDDLFSNICSKWGGEYKDMDSKKLFLNILDALDKEQIKTYRLA